MNQPNINKTKIHKPALITLSKGARTKQSIIAEAARVFNSKGYASVSLTDIMKVTNLKKGGIYRYFGSKEELALSAFDFAYNRLKQRYKSEVFREPNASKRLVNILDLHGSLLSDPYLEGGCPILNTAIDSDGTHPALKAKAQWAMDEWRHTIYAIVTKGIERKELEPVETEQISTVIIASLEGAVMLSKLYSDSGYIHRILLHLKTYISTLAIQKGSHL